MSPFKTAKIIVFDPMKCRSPNVPLQDNMSPFKTAKIIVFDPMKCRSPNVPLQDELLT